MPTKRQRVARKLASRITADVEQTWRIGDQRALDRALRLRPWQASPLIARGDCPWPANSAGAASWPAAVALREELEGLFGSPGAA